jgi:hypothetical protein
MGRLFAAATSDRIIFPGSASISPLSVSVWFRLTSSPGAGAGFVIIATGTGSTGLTGYRIAYENVGADVDHPIKLTFTASSESAVVPATRYAVTLGAALTLNQWYHLVWTQDRAVAPYTATCYLDSVSQSVVLESGGLAGPNISSWGNTYLGALLNTDNLTYVWPLDGTLSEPLVLQGVPVLTQGEVTSLFRGAYFCEMRPPAEYFGAWPLEGLFDPEPDWSGQGRHSTSISGTSGSSNPPTAWYPPLISSYPLELSSGSGTLDLSLAVLVEPTAAVSIVPAPVCADYTGDASRPPEPETGA